VSAPFLLPPPLVAADRLPPAIRTCEPGSFAQRTLAERVPAILKETIALNDFPPDVRDALGELYDELTGGVIRELWEPTADRVLWNAMSAECIGRSWLEVPWYWAEAYFYRRVLQATGYFRPGPGRRLDPFAAKKATELVPAAAPAAVDRILRQLPGDPVARLKMLLRASLWGNRIDLSYEAAARLGRAANPEEGRANLLVDDSGQVWGFLNARQRRTIALLADNAGTELLMDFLLLRELLDQRLADVVELHLKPQPFFVSDAVPPDVVAGLRALEEGSAGCAALAHRLREYLRNRRLRLLTHWHYATSLFYFQLPEDLLRTLAGSDLVIVKGDANYRRLLGDAHWPPTASFAAVTNYFPAALVALRTLKAEIIVGLQPGQAERLQTEDPAWLVNGQRGIIQSRL
jgi:uncharacterized protein with ATP-grasp and redox domains